MNTRIAYYRSNRTYTKNYITRNTLIARLIPFQLFERTVLQSRRF